MRYIQKFCLNISAPRKPIKYAVTINISLSGNRVYARFPSLTKGNMMRFCIFLLLMFINIPSLHAQLEHNIRFFNNRLAIRFLPEFKAYINTKNTPPFESEGRATISDPVKGNLLFYQGVITHMATNNPVDNIVNPLNSTLLNFNHEKIPSQKFGSNYMLHGDLTTAQGYTALASNYECGKYILISLVGSRLSGVNKPEYVPLRGTLAFNILDIKGREEYAQYGSIE